jgi:hypothetical protein
MISHPEETDVDRRLLAARSRKADISAKCRTGGGRLTRYFHIGDPGVGANRNGRVAAIDPLPTRQQAQEALDKQRPVKGQWGYLTF